MFGIGTFARIGHVSVRTLRHYHDVGLLEPDVVDAVTGYRSYRADQFARLNRILALKDLGFSLSEIGAVLDDGVSAEALAGMLRLRQAESVELIEREQARLRRVAHRLSLIEGEHAMSSIDDVIVKPLAPQRVALVSEGSAEIGDDFGPIFGRLYPKLFQGLAALGVAPAGVTIALYDDAGGDAMHIHAGVPVAADAPDRADDAGEIEFRDLPEIERAATLVHQGDMAGIAQSYEALMRWIDANGETAATRSREVYLACDGPQETWVTEIQFPLL